MTGEGLLDAAILLAAALVGGVGARRIGQPPLVGNIIVGVLLGPSLLGWVTTNEAVDLLSELGVVMLLFWVGLEMHFEDLYATRKVSVSAGVLGAILPFLGGLVFAFLIDEGTSVAAFVAAGMVATSVGVTASVLKNFGVLGSTEGKTILGAAVIDDIIAIVVLAVVVVLSGGEGTSDLIWTAAALCAFFVGVGISEIGKRDPVERWTGWLYFLLTPIFFGLIGVKVDISKFADVDTLLLLLAVTSIAVITKYIGVRVPARTLGKQRARFVAAGMVPRGEVGIIVAGIGLAANVLDVQLFTVIVGMSLLTTIFAPPVLRKLAIQPPP